jgi:hypothetical protein
MQQIPKEMRVRLRLLYNGYIHDAVGLRFEYEDGKISIRIFPKHFPMGYAAEHGFDEIELVNYDFPVIPDKSGVDGWVMEEVFNMDAFARSRKTD